MERVTNVDHIRWNGSISFYPFFVVLCSLYESTDFLRAHAGIMLTSSVSEKIRCLRNFKDVCREFEKTHAGNPRASEMCRVYEEGIEFFITEFTKIASKKDTH